MVLPQHPRLGRNVHHDDRSRAFRVQPRQAGKVRPVRHASTLPRLDQANIGRCTGCAGLAAIYSHPFVDLAPARGWSYVANLDGATSLYSDATAIDPFAGTYPPEDTGSDGLSIAKVLKREGVISGYLWAFTIEEALAQLSETPLITGLPWYKSMFETSDDGHAGHVRIDFRSGLAGGHEIAVDELITPQGLTLDTSDIRARLGDIWVGGPNSWGRSWGDDGRWYMRASEWAALLSRRGDVTAFVPNTVPAPEPSQPTGDADDVLWSSVKTWATSRRFGANAVAATAVRKWAKATGRS
jgi:hypothetical protein